MPALAHPRNLVVASPVIRDHPSKTPFVIPRSQH
jgi:hypothetical protein